MRLPADRAEWIVGGTPTDALHLAARVRSGGGSRVRVDADARMTGAEMAVVVPAVAATVTNSLGLIAGGLTGSFGYRREIAALRRWLPGSLTGAVLGALTGAWLLLHLPSETFETVVPVLVGVAAVLVAV